MKQSRQDLNIQTVPHPFSVERIDRLLPVGLTIDEILDRIQPDKRLENSHAAAQKADSKIDALKFEVARHYVTRREHLDAVHRIDSKLDRILDKLDRKADK